MQHNIPGAAPEEPEHGKPPDHPPILPQPPEAHPEVSIEVKHPLASLHPALLSGVGDDGVPNLTDSLFVKIFEKNKFENIEVGG